MKFENTTEFVSHIITRCDHNSETIVGLGVKSPRLCDGYITTGSGSHYVTGYFYNDENGFHDHFIIDDAWGNLASAESQIKQIRGVTDLFYYTGGR